MREARIIHTTVQKDRKKLRVIVQSFAQKMAERINSFKNIDPKIFEHTDETLLKYRKELVDSVKKGMLERKDLELEIAITSAVIWFMRLSKDEQDRVTNLW